MPKPGQLEAAVGRLNAASQAYDVWLTRYDVILSPVLGSPPVELGFVSGSVPFEELQVRLMTYVGYTPVQNVAGAPSMSVPLYWTADGLPVGAHFAARIGREAVVRAGLSAGGRPALGASQAAGQRLGLEAR
jgi:amidase